jgi:hypothetical protein
MRLRTGAPHRGHEPTGVAEKDLRREKPGRQYRQPRFLETGSYSYIGMGEYWQTRCDVTRQKTGVSE